MLTNFILVIKSTQYFQSIFLVVHGFLAFFSCAVLATVPTCATDGPGVGNRVHVEGALVIGYSSLAWVAIALIPYSSQVIIVV